MDAVTEANRRAWEIASHKHVREYDDLRAARLTKTVGLALRLTKGSVREGA
jgi:hypothetical protein